MNVENEQGINQIMFLRLAVTERLTSRSLSTDANIREGTDVAIKVKCIHVLNSLQHSDTANILYKRKARLSHTKGLAQKS